MTVEKASGTGTRSPLIAIWWLLVVSIASRARLAGLGLLGAGAILIGGFIRASDSFNRPGAAWSLVDTYGLSLLVPVVALLFATAVLGDLAEDGTLVYLWLRPVPRRWLAMCAVAASVTVAVPVAVVPLVVGTAISGGGWRLVGAAAAAATLSTVAYSAVFCGLGLRVRRALAWGLAYLLIWEEAVARVSHGAARASLFVSAGSLAAQIARHSPPKNAVAWTTGLGFCLVVTAAAVFVTARSLDSGEIA